jgi:polyhydroxybutyrate depolymerase
MGLDTRIGVATLAVLAAAALPISASGATGASHIAARPSPGCALRSAMPATQTRSFTADGDSSTYVEQAPTQTRTHTPFPVIFDFHGYEQPGQTQVQLSGLGTLGERSGFVTVTPWIDDEPVPMWRSKVESRDLAWFGPFLAHVEATTCVDENRVYVAGYSNGAFMTSAVACQYASKVAAVAPVAGIESMSPCHRPRPVPVVAFHGTADPLVSFDGKPTPADATIPTPDGSGRPIRRSAAAQFGSRGIASKGPTIPEEAAQWARRNGCGRISSSKVVADGVALLQWACPHDADVELYEVTGGGHTWPGSRMTAALASTLGPTTFAITADAIMWAFFQAHPLTAQN